MGKGFECNSQQLCGKALNIIIHQETSIGNGVGQRDPLFSLG
jgi:hypothetical protein